uniref:Putative glutamate/gamma-aminobutyrate antiporter n=1 Tax=Salmonella enterica subsp. indica TaxID=59207 RepID=I3W3T6_SALER|nr:putative glutamate/gamma-aminobutyrate antiporter [Salmonella enterica subsp. indica]
MISQLVITSVALIILTNTGGGSNMSFLIALALTVVIYLCAYFMMFISYMVLVCKHPENKRKFNVPGGKWGKLFIATVGLLTSIIAFVISFLPPATIQGDSTEQYVELLATGFFVVFALPFIVYTLRDKRSVETIGRLVPINTNNAPEGHFFLHPRARSTHHIIVDKIREQYTDKQYTYSQK